MLPILLNQLSAVRARIVMPRNGVWIADVDVDLDVTGVVPSGKVTLVVGTTPMIGTVDPRATGKFGQKAHVQVVGGGGGWDKVVEALHLHNDFGVLSTAVLSVTAASVGEAVVDVTPSRLGIDYVRSTGPAARVLAGLDWYVDVTGVTIVGPRTPIPQSPSLTIVSWDPNTRRAELASDDLVLPGTVLVDTRFGTATVRDVEQTFGPDGARCTAWCDTADTGLLPPTSSSPATKEAPGSRLVRSLSAIAREAVNVAFLRRYRYRIVSEGVDGRLTLQLVNLAAGAPAFLDAVDVAPGMAGLSATHVPGSIVHVVFPEADPTEPLVVAFEKQTPIVFEIDTVVVKIGTGSDAVAKATELVAAINALQTQITAMQAAIVAIGTVPSVGAVPAVPPAISAASSAVTAGTAAVAAATPLIPSIKTFTD